MKMESGSKETESEIKATMKESSKMMKEKKKLSDLMKGALEYDDISVDYYINFARTIYTYDYDDIIKKKRKEERKELKDESVRGKDKKYSEKGPIESSFLLNKKVHISEEMTTLFKKDTINIKNRLKIIEQLEEKILDHMEYKLYVDLGYLSETTRFMTVPRYIQKMIFNYLDDVHSNNKSLLDMIVEQNPNEFALALKKKVNEVDEISRNDGNYNSSNRLVKLCQDFGMDKYTFDYLI